MARTTAWAWMGGVMLGLLLVAGCAEIVRSPQKTKKGPPPPLGNPGVDRSAEERLPDFPLKPAEKPAEKPKDAQDKPADLPSKDADKPVDKPTKPEEKPADKPSKPPDKPPEKPTKPEEKPPDKGRP